jgi:hypothetical protein
VFARSIQRVLEGHVDLALTEFLVNGGAFQRRHWLCVNLGNEHQRALAATSTDHVA